MNKVAVIILNWNGFNDTVELLASLFLHDKTHDYYLLDNGSTNESVEKIKHYLENSCWDYDICNLNNFTVCSGSCNFKFILSDQNYGFAIGNNQILRKIAGKYDYYVLLNNDVVFKESVITNIVSYASKNNVDAISPKILRYCDGNIWYAGGKLNVFGERHYFSDKKIRKVSKEFLQCTFITGCVLCLSNKTLEDIGFLTEDFFFGEEDFQYSYLLRKNKKKVGVLLNTVAYHKVSVSSKTLPRKSTYCIHFINRIVDKRILYGKLKFHLWKFLYVNALFFRTLQIYKHINVTKEIIKVIRKYSKNNKVDKDIFQTVISHHWKF